MAGSHFLQSSIDGTMANCQPQPFPSPQASAGNFLPSQEDFAMHPPSSVSVKGSISNGYSGSYVISTVPHNTASGQPHSRPPRQDGFSIQDNDFVLNYLNSCEFLQDPAVPQIRLDIAAGSGMLDECAAVTRVDSRNTIADQYARQTANIQQESTSIRIPLHLPQGAGLEGRTVASVPVHSPLLHVGSSCGSRKLPSPFPAGHDQTGTWMPATGSSAASLQGRPAQNSSGHPPLPLSVPYHLPASRYGQYFWRQEHGPCPPGGLDGVPRSHFHVSTSPEIDRWFNKTVISPAGPVTTSALVPQQCSPQLPPPISKVPVLGNYSSVVLSHSSPSDVAFPSNISHQVDKRIPSTGLQQSQSSTWGARAASGVGHVAGLSGDQQIQVTPTDHKRRVLKPDWDAAYRQSLVPHLPQGTTELSGAKAEYSKQRQNSKKDNAGTKWGSKRSEVPRTDTMTSSSSTSPSPKRSRRAGGTSPKTVADESARTKRGGTSVQDSGDVSLEESVAPVSTTATLSTWSPTLDSEGVTITIPSVAEQHLFLLNQLETSEMDENCISIVEPNNQGAQFVYTFDEKDASEILATLEAH